MADRTIEIFVTGWLVSFREFMPPYKLDVCGCPVWTFLYVCVYMIVSVLVFVDLSGEICGQSYKASTIVIYDSRVVPDWKIPHITTLES